MATTSAFVMNGYAWSNGGYSADPSYPDYGTHDWIAQHSLDWLPTEEKQYILNNLTAYLYGTELPDNGGAPDGIGDTAKHHIYYNSAEVMTDDAAALRASTEYNNTLSFLKAKDYAKAAKNAGIMSHYIVDVAVFGHVMAAGTDWGAEVHHSDYETYVNTRTSNYSAEFNSYLYFDGSLATVSAFDAAKNLAYDTTFDVDGDLTCVWMDQNYNWSNSTFKNRAGESINLAVNYLTDVLHTLYSEAQQQEHHINVPFDYQVKDYYCGPAALQMVFDFHGENISQYEIADVARTVGYPLYSTFTDELRRAAHFSNISTSMGNEMPENITSYTLRTLGYAAFEAYGMDLTQLKNLIDQDKPLVLLMWYSEYYMYGHYRIVTGYNETHVFLHDPWNNIVWGGKYGGPNLAMNYTFFLDLWQYSGNWGLFVSPWKINLSIPDIVAVNETFEAVTNVQYVCPYPFNTFEYPASNCNITINLPEGLGLAPGENATKKLGNGELKAGNSTQVSWKVKAENTGAYPVSVEAEGRIEGDVGEKPDVGPSYHYGDRIGGVGEKLVTALSDTVPPEILTPTQNPPSEAVGPYQNVTVLVDVTDNIAGVAEVILSFSTDEGATWNNITMTRFEEDTYSGTIPGFPEGTRVQYMVIAYDDVGNHAVNDNSQQYYVFTVVPEFSSLPSLLLSLALIGIAIILVLRNTDNGKNYAVVKKHS